MPTRAELAIVILGCLVAGTCIVRSCESDAEKFERLYQAKLEQCWRAYQRAPVNVVFEKCGELPKLPEENHAEKAE